jgi:hypothetical protein
MSVLNSYHFEPPEWNGPMTILFQPAPLSHEESARSSNYEFKGKLIPNNLSRGLLRERELMVCT